jgi:predicted TIM-barrel fold metal-dependent hydrolase
MLLYDANVMLGESALGYKLDLTTLRAHMLQYGIGRAVLSPARPPSYDLAAANNAVARAVIEEPDRFNGFARIDPWQGAEAVAELDRAITNLGLKGMFLHPWEDRFCISETLVDPLMQRADELGVPVMIAGGYTNVSHPSQIRALATRHPNVAMLATHGGQLNISGMLLSDAQAMLRACPNVQIDTCGVYREDFIEDCIAEFGPGRVVFGSGTPVFHQGFETLRVRFAHLADEVKHQIGWINIEQLVRASGSRRASAEEPGHGSTL